jgi:hypothetical protein
MSMYIFQWQCQRHCVSAIHPDTSECVASSAAPQTLQVSTLLLQGVSQATTVWELASLLYLGFHPLQRVLTNQAVLG